MGELVLEDFNIDEFDCYASHDDLSVIDERVRDLAESARPGTFQDLWSLLATDQDLESEGRRDRWRVRSLAELSWFCLLGGDRGFRVWDADKLGRHLRRLQALRLGVPEHEGEGVDFAWEAMHWTGEQIGWWEQFIAGTGSDTAPLALETALKRLIRSRCHSWPRVDIDPELFGSISLSTPEGEGISFDIDSNWNDRRTCLLCRGNGPGQFDYDGDMLDWADPELLRVLTAFLQEAKLDPRPPEWPLDMPSAG